MKITSATASSLGEKLAGLDLTVEEGVLLTSMLTAGDASDAEVEGFGNSTSPRESYMKIEMEKVSFTKVLGPLPGAWKIEEGQGYTEVEWTY